MTDNEPSTEPMLQFFINWEHLPKHLQELSIQFANLAKWVVGELPRNPERTTMLRKLLEAKDCVVRARLYREPTGGSRS